eukprot:847516_1
MYSQIIATNNTYIPFFRCPNFFLIWFAIFLFLFHYNAFLDVGFEFLRNNLRHTLSKCDCNCRIRIATSSKLRIPVLIPTPFSELCVVVFFSKLSQLNGFLSDTK